MKRPALALAAGLVAAGAHGTERDAGSVPLDADAILMGELHDVAAHHANQAEWVARLQPAAIVFEMLPPELGPVAERHRFGVTAILNERLGWEARGWPDFGAYDPIFKASGEARIFGAEVPGAALEVAVSEGAAAAFKGDAARFGLDRPLGTPERDARIAEQADAHCNLLPETLLPGMVEAQRLRDATLAARVLEAFEATGGPVAVITGNGHARRDRGVPRFLHRLRPDLEVIALGQFTEPADSPPFDAWVVSEDDGPDRGDPCDALR